MKNFKLYIPSLSKTAVQADVITNFTFASYVKIIIIEIYYDWCCFK